MMRSCLKISALGIALVLLASGCAQSPKVENPEYDPDKLAELNVKLAVEYMRDDKNDIALRRLQKALEFDPQYPAAHSTLGVLYARLGEDDKADRHFKDAVKREPGNPVYLNNYGQFLCKQNRYDKGMELFERALEDPLYKNPEVAHTNAGLCAVRAGELDRAESSFRSALQIRPNFAIALREMAQISLTNEEHLSARAYLQRYREVAANTPATLWMGVQVERALGDLDTAASYALTLKSKFPDSEEAKMLQQSESE